MYNQQKWQLPLLGTLTQQQFHDDLLETITDEASAIDFYTRLMKQAPDDLNYDFLNQIREDEMKHLSNFERLYIQYFGAEPQYTIKNVQFPSYKEGILMSLQDESGAAEFYRDIQLSVMDPLIRDTFYLAMVDELRHATLLSTLYNLAS